MTTGNTSAVPRLETGWLFFVQQEFFFPRNLLCGIFFTFSMLCGIFFFPSHFSAGFFSSKKISPSICKNVFTFTNWCIYIVAIAVIVLIWS